MWYRIYMLVVKELLTLLRDPKSRVVLIAPPLIQLIVFAYAATLEVKNIHLAVLNQDRGGYAHELVQRFVGSPYFTHIEFVDHPSESRRLIETQQVTGAIHIREDFSRSILSGKPGSLQVVADGRNSNTAQITNAYIEMIVETLARDIATELGRSLPASTVINRPWFNPNLEFRWAIVPSLLGTLLIVLGIVVTGMTVARERELGTFDQLLVSPLRSFEILIGKVLPSLIIGVFQGTLLFIASVVFFRIPFVGSLFYLYLSMIAYLLSVSGVGLFISSLAATQQQAILGAFVFIVPAIIISGFTTPVENMPNWLQTVSLFDPVRHFLVIIKGIYFKNMGIGDLSSSLGSLLGIGLVTMGLAIWLFRRKMA